MDALAMAIGRNIRKYRKLKGLTLEQLAAVLDTETNYLGQCERGERRFGLDKLMDIISYFGLTANDIISPPAPAKSNAQADGLRDIVTLLENCTDNQLSVIQNILRDCVPFLKE